MTKSTISRRNILIGTAGAAVSSAYPVNMIEALAITSSFTWAPLTELELKHDLNRYFGHLKQVGDGFARMADAYTKADRDIAAFEKTYEELRRQRRAAKRR